MHPGPINRGVELSSDAADSQHSIILDQVENGVAVRMAVLYLLAGNKISSGYSSTETGPAVYSLLLGHIFRNFDPKPR
jgi:hypothetical protein